MLQRTSQKNNQLSNRLKYDYSVWINENASNLINNFSPITVFRPCQETLILKRFGWISHHPDLVNSCSNRWNSGGHFQRACKIATIIPHDFLLILRRQISKRHYLPTFSQTEKKILHRLVFNFDFNFWIFWLSYQRNLFWNKNSNGLT